MRNNNVLLLLLFFVLLTIINAQFISGKYNLIKQDGNGCFGGIECNRLLFQDTDLIQILDQITLKVSHEGCGTFEISAKAINNITAIGNLNGMNPFHLQKKNKSNFDYVVDAGNCILSYELNIFNFTPTINQNISMNYPSPTPIQNEFTSGKYHRISVSGNHCFGGIECNNLLFQNLDLTKVSNQITLKVSYEGCGTHYINAQILDDNATTAVGKLNGVQFYLYKEQNSIKYVAGQLCTLKFQLSSSSPNPTDAPTASKPTTLTPTREPSSGSVTININHILSLSLFFIVYNL